MRVQVHPQAADELNSAIDYHNKLRSGLGDRLRMAVHAAVTRNRKNPTRYRFVHDDIRRCLVEGFPYSVLYYIVEDNLLKIIVVRHHRRRADFGMRRT